MINFGSEFLVSWMRQNRLSRMLPTVSASVIALIWENADPISAEDRYRQLSRAHYQIGTTLEKIKAAINGG